MKARSILLASLLMTGPATLGGCDLVDEPKNLTPDQICDAVYCLTPAEQGQLSDKLNQRHKASKRQGAKPSSE
ncbi:hypothetical protein Q7L80_04350 [Candidatus Liberibacter asiaticus]